MALLPFILCWDKRIALMIIQIFTEKKFSFNFWTAGPLNVVENNSIIAFQCEIIHPNRRGLIFTHRHLPPPPQSPLPQLE